MCLTVCTFQQEQRGKGLSVLELKSKKNSFIQQMVNIRWKQPLLPRLLSAHSFDFESQKENPDQDKEKYLMATPINTKIPPCLSTSVTVKVLNLENMALYSSALYWLFNQILKDNGPQCISLPEKEWKKKHDGLVKVKPYVW